MACDAPLRLTLTERCWLMTWLQLNRDVDQSRLIQPFIQHLGIPSKLLVCRLDSRASLARWLQNLPFKLLAGMNQSKLEGREVYISSSTDSFAPLHNRRFGKGLASSGGRVSEWFRNAGGKYVHEYGFIPRRVAQPPTPADNAFASMRFSPSISKSNQPPGTLCSRDRTPSHGTDRCTLVDSTCTSQGVCL
ncbi:hypothetical protein BKA56DRAFT_663748 [Ilyonectria sp. MPI-CAGE-AT-0026]|nr:hypothetical protein BKA56DRAFT_663748 [Ilyonectria sp. MPI-CAGE-AT-0026]